MLNAAGKILRVSSVTDLLKNLKFEVGLADIRIRNAPLMTFEVAYSSERVTVLLVREGLPSPGGLLAALGHNDPLSAYPVPRSG